jgi:dynein heavy chain
MTLFRRHLDYQHWYDRAAMMIRYVTDVDYVTRMNPTASSFHINSRLQRHFWTFALGIPSDGSVKFISFQMLDGHFEYFGFPLSFWGILRKLLDTVVNIHKEIMESFMPTAVKFHDTFNMRDTSQVLQGLLHALPTVVTSLEKMILLCATG